MTKETKIKKLTLKKETLRDLTAHNAGEIKAGGRGGNGNTKKCRPTMTCYTYCGQEPHCSAFCPV
jgi:hypothetical protein